MLSDEKCARMVHLFQIFCLKFSSAGKFGVMFSCFLTVVCDLLWVVVNIFFFLFCAITDIQKHYFLWELLFWRMQYIILIAIGYSNNLAFKARWKGLKLLNY